PALLARVPRRAGPRGRPSEDRLRIRSRVTPPRAAAGVRSAFIVGSPRPTGPQPRDVLPLALAADPAVLAQRRDQIAQARTFVEPVHELFDPRRAVGAEHHARQLAKLRADLVFAIRILVVSARALAKPRELAAIGERHGHACRLEARHRGGEGRI